MRSNTKNILIVVGWKKLCTKTLFNTKVVLKYFFRIYLKKKSYAKIMYINYKFLKLYSCGGENVPEKETYVSLEIAC